MFVVATSAKQAKARALRAVSGWKDKHDDDLYEAEYAFALDTKIGERLFIHLKPSENNGEPLFTCQYTPLP